MGGDDAVQQQERSTSRKLTDQTTGFRCPFWFDEKTGTWTLKPNNKDYTGLIADEINNPPRAVEK
jgi:hypothetical protein